MLTIRNRQIELMEQAKRRATAWVTLQAMQKNLPLCLAGLTAQEVSERFERAVAKTGRYALRTVADVQTYIKLSVVLGPEFDCYPPFLAVLAAGAENNRIDRLVSMATEADWNRAAVFSVIRSRERRPHSLGGDSCGIRFEPVGEQNLKSLFDLAAHPDVWRPANLTPQLDFQAYRRHLMDLGKRVNRHHLAIVHPRDGCVGALTSERADGADLVYFWIGRAYWNRGIASEALGCYLSGSHAAGAARTIAYVFEENLPAVQVLTRHGFSVSGDVLPRHDGLRAYDRRTNPSLED
jgi:RimJ/RimL family protein N-acetyltransferase